MNLDNLSTEVKASLYDRVRNPFLSNLAIGWIVFNYKLVLVLVFDNIPEAIKLTDYLGDLQLLNTSNTIIFPILYSLVLTFIGPPIWFIINWYTDFFKGKTRGKRNKLLSNYISESESVEFMQNIMEREGQFSQVTKQLLEKSTLVTNLNKQLERFSKKTLFPTLLKSELILLSPDKPEDRFRVKIQKFNDPPEFLITGEYEILNNRSLFVLDTSYDQQMHMYMVEGVIRTASGYSVFTLQSEKTETCYELYAQSEGYKMIIQEGFHSESTTLYFFPVKSI